MLDPEPPQRLVQPGFQGPAAEQLEPLLRRAVGVQVHEVSLVRVELEPDLPHLPQCSSQEVVDGGAWVQDVLRQVADAVADTRRDRAAVRCSNAGQQAQERGLADAVRADEPGAGAVVERQREAVEQRREGEIGALEHGGPFG